MVVVLLIDLGFNCSLDYDTYNDVFNNNILLGLFGLQVVIQLSAFLVLFLAMADTFLFRVGLLGLLMKKFRTVLAFHILYIVLTIACGSYRVKQYGSGKTLALIWRDKNFIGLSCVQKFFAIPYYVLNMRAG